MTGFVRGAGVVLLVLGGLYYLQFGLQALDDLFLQGALTLVGAVALLAGAIRVIRRRPAAALVLAGTLPILVLHLAMTLEDPGELIFLIGSIPVPALAAIAWAWGRRPGARPA